MSQISNLHFPKVFVFNPSTELVVVNTARPNDLTLGQVGFFNAITGVGSTSTITPTTAPALVVHQNLGDNKFGTTRTRTLFASAVRDWRGVKAALPADQISYVGYDEVDNTKNLVAYVGQVVELVITVWGE